MKLIRFTGLARTLSYVSLLFLSCNSPTEKDEKYLTEARSAIAESNAVYFQAFVKGDSSIFIDRYAKDCCIMPPNVASMCGGDAALNFFRLAFYNMALRDGNFVTTAVYGNGDGFVTEEGKFQLRDGSNAIIDDGKYLVLWKKTDNGWKMFRDCFSSNHSAK